MQAAGHRLATFISSITTIVVGLGIAFIFGWQLALAILAGFPILVAAGYIQIQVQKGGQKKDAELLEDAGRVATEAIQSIKTVQSFSIERLFYEKYMECLLPVYMYGIIVCIQRDLILNLMIFLNFSGRLTSKLASMASHLPFLKL